MVDELQLDNDCSHMFQISMMQESAGAVDNSLSGNVDGNTMPDLTGGILLGQFVQITSFDMSEDFGTDGIISTEVSGAFLQDGYLSSLYVTEDFVAVMSDGYIYDYQSGNYFSKTYILGFDTTTGIALPFSVGSVPGNMASQHAADVWDGHLRVATIEWNWTDVNVTTSQKIFVLRLPGPQDKLVMEVVGEMELMDDAFIYEVRFFDNKCYVETDGVGNPFIIIDLSDHSDPHSVGELEVRLVSDTLPWIVMLRYLPISGLFQIFLFDFVFQGHGVSTYLHEISIDNTTFILGVGYDWNTTTWDSGLMLTLFDVSNPSSPKIAASYLDLGSSTDAQYDVQAIRYLPDSKNLIIHKSKYTWSADGNFDGFAVFEISVDEIKSVYNISHAESTDIYGGCWYDAHVPPRSLVFQSKLTTIMGHTVVSTDMETQVKQWEIDLDASLNYSKCEDYFYGYSWYSYNNTWDYGTWVYEDNDESSPSTVPATTDIPPRA